MSLFEQELQALRDMRDAWDAYGNHPRGADEETRILLLGDALAASEQYSAAHAARLEHDVAVRSLYAGGAL